MKIPVLDSQPQWVAEHVEGLNFLEQERQRKELEAQLPGITRVFKDLIGQLPSPNLSDVTEFPVAACVVKKGDNGLVEVVSTAANATNRRSDSTAHAELEAIKAAEDVTGTKHLEGQFLLTTLEPCTMCCGAAVNADLAGVVYGTRHDDVENTHALVGGQFKPYRTSPESFNADDYLTDSGLIVVGSFMRTETLDAIHRTPVSIADYYRDPDA